MYFPVLPKIIPEEAILRRLGYHKNETDLDKETASWVHRTIMAASQFIHPAGTYDIADVMQCGNSSLILKCTQDFRWEIHGVPGLCRMFAHARFALIAATTIGPALNAEITRQFQISQEATATVYDATGSECADAAMDTMQTLAIQQLRPQGLFLDSHRFSPGYGNWPLQHQQFFFSVLNLDKSLHLTLTPSFLISPEKSVTAIAPVFSHEL